MKKKEITHLTHAGGKDQEWVADDFKVDDGFLYILNSTREILGVFAPDAWDWCFKVKRQ